MECVGYVCPNCEVTLIASCTMCGNPIWANRFTCKSKTNSKCEI